MRTIEWQENDFEFEEETPVTFATPPRNKEKMSEEVDKDAYQLKKHQHPSKDAQRQEILTLIESFVVLLVTGDYEKIAIDLLEENFEAFVFSSAGRTPVQHKTGPQGFIDLYKNTKITQRRIRTIDVDADSKIAWQICEYEIIYHDESASALEVACEVFTIKNKKISKYRASFGHPTPDMNNFEKFLFPTRKDKMFAKVKEINYALSGQPDFEKITSLFHQNTEYRIWRWGDHKCFTLNKANFSSSFESIEEEMCIRSVVPYELSIDTQQKFISGTYVYHLEERSSGDKFIWFSTCIYSFDSNVDLMKISQQGELYPEDDVEIPFEFFTREFLVTKVTDFLRAFDKECEAFYNDTALYDSKFYQFLPVDIPNPGYFQGMKHFHKLEAVLGALDVLKVNAFRVVDAYVDHHNESYDVVFALLCVQATNLEKEAKNTEEEEEMICFSIFHLENGKIAKEVDFMSRLTIPIPTPFDDTNFKCINIK